MRSDTEISIIRDDKNSKVQYPSPWLETLKWAFWLCLLGGFILMLAFSGEIVKAFVN